ncbi:MAG TPA: carboxypeptidase-like regulatory domain-containing protein, partial [Actinomycetota bacterium]|nr:carboxypeptidase-like regulatory domain-containing protein [Actinomycetota bacterium]
WSEVPQGVQGGELWSVEASGPDDIWAAGDVLGPTRSTLVEHAPSATSGAVVGQTNVSFAVVSWFGPETGSVETDSLGDYQVGGLTAGRYLFTVQEQGCQPDSAEVTVTAGDTIRQDLQVTC